MEFVNFNHKYRELLGPTRASEVAKITSSSEAGQNASDFGSTELVRSLVKLVNSAYRGDSSKAGWTTEADMLDGQRTDEVEIRRLLEDEKENILGMTASDGTPVACVRLHNDGQSGYLGMLTVSPTLQAQGTGRELLARAENWARRERKIGEMYMTVITIRTALIDWYVRRGYTLTNEFEAFPYGDSRFGIPLRDDLRFQILRKRLVDDAKS